MFTYEHLLVNQKKKIIFHVLTRHTKCAQKVHLKVAMEKRFHLQKKKFFTAAVPSLNFKCTTIGVQKKSR